MTALIDAYDAAFFDLDGVIYLGPKAVRGATSALAELGSRGVATMFVTNNAARPAQVVIDQLNDLGFQADENNVLTSAQVAVSYLARELPTGARVLVNGSANLVNLVAEAGFVPVETAAERPDAVLQGYDPKMTWARLDEAALALQAGAVWYATNSDASRPTDRGLVPGAGGQIAVLGLVVGGEPTTFGKPNRPMLAEAVRRTGASRPIFVGDRLDTDIAGAVNAGMDSLLVFTGAHGKADLVAAQPGERPTQIGADVRALLEPPRKVQIGDTEVVCGEQSVHIGDGGASIDGHSAKIAQQYDALWALANLAWLHPGLDVSQALDALDLIP